MSKSTSLQSSLRADGPNKLHQTPRGARSPLPVPEHAPLTPDQSLKPPSASLLNHEIHLSTSPVGNESVMGIVRRQSSLGTQGSGTSARRSQHGSFRNQTLFESFAPGTIPDSLKQRPAEPPEGDRHAMPIPAGGVVQNRVVFDVDKEAAMTAARKAEGPSVTQTRSETLGAFDESKSQRKQQRTSMTSQLKSPGGNGYLTESQRSRVGPGAAGAGPFGDREASPIELEDREERERLMRDLEDSRHQLVQAVAARNNYVQLVQELEEELRQTKVNVRHLEEDKGEKMATIIELQKKIEVLENNLALTKERNSALAQIEAARKENQVPVIRASASKGPVRREASGATSLGDPTSPGQGDRQLLTANGVVVSPYERTGSVAMSCGSSVFPSGMSSIEQSACNRHLIKELRDENRKLRAKIADLEEQMSGMVPYVPPHRMGNSTRVELEIHDAALATPTEDGEDGEDGETERKKGRSSSLEGLMKSYVAPQRVIMTKSLKEMDPADGVTALDPTTGRGSNSRTTGRSRGAESTSTGSPFTRMTSPFSGWTNRKVMAPPVGRQSAVYENCRPAVSAPRRGVSKSPRQGTVTPKGRSTSAGQGSSTQGRSNAASARSRASPTTASRTTPRVTSPKAHKGPGGPGGAHRSSAPRKTGTHATPTRTTISSRGQPSSSARDGRRSLSAPKISSGRSTERTPTNLRAFTRATSGSTRGGVTPGV